MSGVLLASSLCDAIPLPSRDRPERQVCPMLMEDGCGLGVVVCCGGLASVQRHALSRQLFFPKGEQGVQLR